MSIEEHRTRVVKEHVAQIEEILRGDATRQTLEAAAQVLRTLAAQTHLFPADDFPPPEPGKGKSINHLLHKNDDDTFALYLISIAPGKTTPPHNHTTWAIIVALEGQEINTLYRANGPVGESTPVPLEVTGKVVVEPGGAHLTFLPDDIHSIEVVGDRPTRHFHLYGQALERLTERLAFDTQTGEARRYQLSAPQGR